MGLLDGARDRETVDRALSALGFAVIVAEDTSTRPIRTAWYSTYRAGRNVCATIVRRKMLTREVEGGNRHTNVVCLQISMEAQLAHPLGFAVHHPLADRPPASVAEAFPPGGAGERLSPAAKDAFVRFIQPQPGEPRRRGRHLRFVDRATLADYFPAAVHPTATTLVMHTIMVDEPLAATVHRDLDQMAWVAWSLETGIPMPSG